MSSWEAFFESHLEGLLNAAFSVRSAWRVNTPCMRNLTLLLDSPACVAGRQPLASASWRQIVRRARALTGPFAVAVLLLGSLATGHARDPERERDDHNRARAAVQAGQAMPLAVLLERLQRGHPGQVLEVEFEREEGRWIYEVKLLQAGQLVRLDVDAATGEVLRQRPGKNRSAR